ncbi:MAG TPA: polysaccharide deacetylase family protein [Acidimicrobiales bacterium]|nr:polysaccharide deacetylase family protein [Acidimicrobiales bacterium]
MSVGGRIRPIATPILAVLVIAVSVAVTQPPSEGLTRAATAPNLAAGQPIGFGNAGSYGSVAGQTLAAAPVGMASTPSGNGYWLVASDGGIFAFGDAQFWGSTGGQRLNKPVVGMAATPDGLGYWLVASDGGIFAYGDAQFWGSTGSQALNKPVVGMAASPVGKGYWLVATDGGIFAFGVAQFWGSMGATRLQAPVVGMAATPSGNGYWLAAADGGVFNFGDAPFLGSIGGEPIPDPIVGVAAVPGGGGFWLLPGPPPPPMGGPTVAGLVISNLSNLPGGLYPAGDKVVALTFDDGPNPVYTPQMLQVLNQYHVPATFEIVGYEGAARPDLLKAEVADGMTLTNHTWDHASLISLNPGQFAGEVDATTNLIQSVTGQAVMCVRPPYGYTNGSVVAQLAQRGLGELLWDIDPSDYSTPGTGVITNRVLSALHPGAIIIMHDGGGDRSQTVAALPAIITGIQAAGYTLEPVCN